MASVTAVIGWGVLAQQLILAAYKTFLPFLGGLTTIPLVYGATVGLGYAAKTVIEARKKDQTVTKEHLKRIAEEYRKIGMAEAKQFSRQSLLAELRALQSSDYPRFKREFCELYEEMKKYEEEIRLKDRQLEESRQREETMLKERTLLIDKIETLKRELKQTREENEELMESACAKEEELKKKQAELDQKDQEIERLRQQQEEINSEKVNLSIRQQRAKVKQKEILRDRYRKLYPDIEINDKALDFLATLHYKKEHIFQQQLSYLQRGEKDKVHFRGKIHGTDFQEIGFADDGRIYIQFHGNKTIVHLVGNKSTQPHDIAYLRRISSQVC